MRGVRKENSHPKTALLFTFCFWDTNKSVAWFINQFRILKENYESQIWMANHLYVWVAALRATPQTKLGVTFGVTGNIEGIRQSLYYWLLTAFFFLYYDKEDWVCLCLRFWMIIFWGNDTQKHISVGHHIKTRNINQWKCNNNFRFKIKHNTLPITRASCHTELFFKLILWWIKVDLISFYKWSA